MSIRHTRLRIGSVASAALLLALAGPTAAQSARQECSAKYQAAKSAGTLAGQTWPQFFSRCMIESKAPVTGPQPAPAVAAPQPDAAPEPSPAEVPAVTTATPPPAPNDVVKPVPPASEEAPAAAAAAPEPPSPDAPAPAATAPDSDAAAPAPVASPLKPVSPQVPGVPDTTAGPETPPEPPEAAPAVAKEPPGSPVFPAAIAPAYAKDNPEIARKKTCLDQFKANRATNANGGLRWIQKGGGYYSLCNKHLKANL